MSLELFFASGYTHPQYGSDGNEVDLIKAQKWSPSSRDLEAAATNSGGGTGIASLAELITAIGKKKPGTIDELGIITHASSSYFSLTGKVFTSGAKLPDVFLTDAGRVDVDTLRGMKGRIDAVKDRFAAKAQIVLYACHSGLDDSLLDAMAQAFGVCVYGFSQEVSYLVQWTEPGKRIISRGKTYIDWTGGVATGMIRPSTLAEQDIHVLSPDRKSSSKCADYLLKTEFSDPAGAAAR